MQRHLAIQLCCTLLIISACSADSGTVSSLKPAAAVSCEIPENAFSNLPTEALVGADLAPMSNFKPKSGTAELNATYRLEMGGAIISVASIQVKETLQLDRKYAEPGMPPEGKIYDSTCLNGNKLFSKNLRAIITDDGLLWLELDIQSNFIPADYWLFLQ